MLDLKLKDFEGPLDLLLELINKKKLDILNIPIAEITEQYNKVIKSWDVFNLNEASSYVLMAARLMQIKSSELLPETNEEEISPKEELENQLIEYARFKQIAKFLNQKEDIFNTVLKKDPEYFQEPQKPVIKKISKNKLYRLFKRISEDNNLKKPLSFKPDKYLIEEQIKLIIEKLKIDSKFSFNSLNKTSDIEEVLTNFLAVLECYKRGICQIETENQIIITTS